MNRDTIALYNREAQRWARARKPVRRAEAETFAGAVRSGGVRVDVGCGAGRYLGDLGAPAIAMDASIEMVKLARETVPMALPLLADVSALPLRRGSVAGAWAAMTYHHIERERVPMALADLHRALESDAVVDLTVVAGEYEGTALPGDDFPGRYFASWTPDWLAEVMTGAGFVVHSAGVTDKDQAHVVATRARTLPDTVGPNMRVLVCGLNPSIYSADLGVGYARPGNRFWPAAVDAGLVTVPLDPVAALQRDGVGITDLVKRATVAASELTKDEYRAGADRVRRLVKWLRPGAICFVGMAGYRIAVDKGAQPGWQPQPFADRPAYVMPSTSGLNASTRFDTLVAHLKACAGH
ncbi:MAG: methyltransferase domain-containing protein [Actinobacteria bacterium]|nr:methyltransferase domain-containing protein [Actinomycetota bacterium]